MLLFACTSLFLFAAREGRERGKDPAEGKRGRRHQRHGRDLDTIRKGGDDASETHPSTKKKEKGKREREGGVGRLGKKGNYAEFLFPSLPGERGERIKWWNKKKKQTGTRTFYLFLPVKKGKGRKKGKRGKWFKKGERGRRALLLFRLREPKGGKEKKGEVEVGTEPTKGEKGRRTVLVISSFPLSTKKGEEQREKKKSDRSL